ncbi:MAG: hypothetical protein ACRDVM_03205 [Acidimicrobiia bacterium]
MEEIEGYHSPEGALLSVYVSPMPGRASSALLSDLLKPVRGRCDRLDRPAAMSLRRDLDRVHDLAPRLDTEKAPGVAVFACSAQSLFDYRQLPSSVWDHASVGPRPYLRPLRGIPDPMAVGVAVVDRRRARVYSKLGADLQELGPVSEADIGKTNYGGFHGYAEQRARSRAEEATARMLREAAELLFAHHREHPVRLLALGGHQETLDELRPHLHPYLRELATRTFVIDSRTMTPALVREAVDALECQERRQLEERLVGEVMSTAMADGVAVIGLGRVLQAANAKAIKRLVVAGRFAKDGIVCIACRRLGRSGDPCDLCGGHTWATEDVVAEAMEVAAADGSEVHQVSVASPLDAHGVAATLRFPLWP